MQEKIIKILLEVFNKLIEFDYPQKWGFDVSLDINEKLCSNSKEGVLGALMCLVEVSKN